MNLCEISMQLCVVAVVKCNFWIDIFAAQLITA